MAVLLTNFRICEWVSVHTILYCECACESDEWLLPHVGLLTCEHVGFGACASASLYAISTHCTSAHTDSNMAGVEAFWAKLKAANTPQALSKPGLTSTQIAAIKPVGDISTAAAHSACLHDSEVVVVIGQHADEPLDLVQAQQQAHRLTEQLKDPCASVRQRACTSLKVGCYSRHWLGF